MIMRPNAAHAENLTDIEMLEVVASMNISGSIATPDTPVSTRCTAVLQPPVSGNQVHAS